MSSPRRTKPQPTGNSGPWTINSRDVARLAGVSQSTVSRALSGKSNVRPDTRARIEKAASELGYIPNAAARTLHTQHTYLLGLVVSNITNAFYPAIVESVTSTGWDRGYMVVLGNAMEDATRQAEYLRLLSEQRVDGAILTSVLRGGTAEIESMLGAGLKLVLANRMADDLLVDSVAVDNVEAGRLVTSHLVGHGHRRIAYIGGREDAQTDHDRFEGYALALRNGGIDHDETLVSHGLFTRAYGYERMLELLDGGHDVDAVVGGDDTIALGAYDAILSRGLRVGTDIAVVGFDDIAEASLRSVWLTTVSSAAALMGRRAVELVLDRVGGFGGPPRRIILPTELIVRGSCGHRSDSQ